MFKLDLGHGNILFIAALAGLMIFASASTGAAQTTKPAAAKTLIDYFQPMPIQSKLSKTAWGSKTVGPRDPQNGLEDMALKDWNYWDGQIIKRPDGKYNMFASRWEQAKGHNAWSTSRAIYAVSDSPMGPFVDKGLLWPDNQGGKGHNVTALTLPDGRYAVVVSETRPGDVFISKGPDGPWEYQGSMKFEANGFSTRGTTSNDMILLRPDGNFEIIARPGAIMLSTTGIMGPYKIMGKSIYPGIAGLPQHNLEDPVIWYSGGLYHITVNCWSDRKAFHLTSVDGITKWTNRGLAYDPDADFLRYTDGTVNHWNKIERPNVFIEDGHVKYFSFAVIDVPKDDEKGNDGHGSKVIVVPFDGAGLDRDLENSARK